MCLWGTGHTLLWCGCIEFLRCLFHGSIGWFASWSGRQNSPGCPGRLRASGVGLIWAARARYVRKAGLMCVLMSPGPMLAIDCDGNLPLSKSDRVKPMGIGRPTTLRLRPLMHCRWRTDPRPTGESGLHGPEGPRRGPCNSRPGTTLGAYSKARSPSRAFRSSAPS